PVTPPIGTDDPRTETHLADLNATVTERSVMHTLTWKRGHLSNALDGEFMSILDRFGYLVILQSDCGIGIRILLVRISHEWRGSGTSRSHPASGLSDSLPWNGDMAEAWSRF